MMTKSGQWIVSLQTNPQARLHLFCFPHGGGSAVAYYNWKGQLPEGVALYAIQLPGRGFRFREPPMTSLSLLVQELREAISPYLDKSFAFFGHSIGALIAFELARELRKNTGHLPRHLFVSARRAPQITDSRPSIHQLPDAEFLKEVERYNGIPREILNEGSLMQLMLPPLRADFECVETYVYKKEPPLECPISCYGGSEDPNESYNNLEAWREQTCAHFSIKIIPGDHFFIQTNRVVFLETLTKELKDLL